GCCAAASATGARGVSRAPSVVCMASIVSRGARRDCLCHHAAVCCILAILAFFGPRLALFLAWVFTPPYLSRAFDTFLIPFLGFVFLPWTTIAYAIAQNELGGLNGIGLLVVILGVLADVGVLGGGARQRRG